MPRRLSTAGLVQHPAPRRRLGIAGLAAIGAVLLLGTSGCSIMRAHEGPTAYVDDSALTARIKTELIKDPHVKASEINVHTYAGRVSLTGIVDSAAMAARVERIVRETPGVASVQSTLQVAKPAPVPKPAPSGAASP